jgi:hypothetical protein
VADDPRFLVYTARNIAAFATHDDSVIMQIDCPDLGMSPDVKLSFRLGPEEARQVAAVLLRKADEAEATRHPRQ